MWIEGVQHNETCFWDPRRGGQGRLAVYMVLSNARLKQVDEVLG